jgi:hypothetical protein
MAWRGIDPLSIRENQPLPSRDRVIAAIVGALLLIPLINTIIWIFMLTFGHPDILAGSQARYVPPAAPERREAPESPRAEPVAVASDPDPDAAPEIAPAAVDAPPPGEAPAEPAANAPLPEAPVVAAPPLAAAPKARFPRIERLPGKIVVTTSTSTSTFHPNHTLNEFFYEKGSRTVSVKLKKDKKLKRHVLEIQNQKSGRPTKPIKIPRPKGKTWVQESVYGFTEFALSEKRKMHYFSFNKETNSLDFWIAEKSIEKSVKDRKFLKIDIRPDTLVGRLSPPKKSIWIDPNIEKSLQTGR